MPSINKMIVWKYMVEYNQIDFTIARRDFESVGNRVYRTEFSNKGWEREEDMILMFGTIRYYDFSFLCVIYDMGLDIF